MAIPTFVQSLKSFYREGSLDPHIQEEYLNKQGCLDMRYIMETLDAHTTEPKFKSLVNTELGAIRFTQDANENEVSRDLFKQNYTFGTFPNVRGWIGYFYRTMDLVLTREALYDYILERQT